MSQAIVIIVGGMNVSIGGIGGLAAITIGFAIQVFGLHPMIAVVLTRVQNSGAPEDMSGMSPEPWMGWRISMVLPSGRRRAVAV